jgi:uncharacterized DUF497 family protein
MRFDWDSQKSLTNMEKHGIDFQTAKSLWFDDDRVEIEMAWTAIYTVRNETVRLISVRRSRTKEVRLYEEKKAGRRGG